MILDLTTLDKWTDILGFEGLYQISDKGKVRKVLPDDENNIPKYKMIKLVSLGAHYEYRGVCLTKDHVSKLYYIHRLVAEAFIGLPGDTNPDGTPMRTSPEINHKDGVPTNNTPDNLEWCDRYYNNAHRRESKKWVYTKATKETGRAETKHSSEMIYKMIRAREEQLIYFTEMNNKITGLEQLVGTDEYWQGSKYRIFRVVIGIESKRGLSLCDNRQKWKIRNVGDVAQQR
mgnify:CR=1 FL=1